MNSVVLPSVERYEKCIQTAEPIESPVVRVPNELTEKQEKPVSSRLNAQPPQEERVPKNTITAIKKSNCESGC